MKQSNKEGSCLILSIETSCDETSAAIVRNGKEVLSNSVSSQVDVHCRFGGVVPEIASRKHVETITVMLEQAVKEADVTIADVDAIAVTQGPGLVGSLLVGIVAAKSLSMVLDIPLIGTHHIAGHIYANRLVGELEYPCTALVVSGGHTELVILEEEGKFQVIGRTRDDAVGEAYDKFARAIGFPYPGGPFIDQLTVGSQEEVELPRAWLDSDSYDFSFSGLKSAVLNAVNQAKMKGNESDFANIARGFQQSVIDVLIGKTMRAVKQYNTKQLLLCGGVAANCGLRAALIECCKANGLPLLIPPLEYCKDNAAMIGAAAYLKWKKGQFTPLDFKVEPSFPLEMW